MCMLSRSVVSHSLQPPGPVAHQASLSMEFSRQESWSGWPFPTPGDLPDPGIQPMSLASPALAGGFFTTSAAKPLRLCLVAPLPRVSLTDQPACPPVSLLPSPSLSLLRFVVWKVLGHASPLPSLVYSLLTHIYHPAMCQVQGYREKRNSVSLKAGPI